MAVVEPADVPRAARSGGRLSYNAWYKNSGLVNPARNNYLERHSGLGDSAVLFIVLYLD